MLKGSEDALWDAYDVAMLDLDGVVYIGPDAVPGAAEPPGRRAQGRACTSPTSPTTPRGPPDAVAAAPARPRRRGRRRRRGHLGPGGGAAARRAAARGVRGVRHRRHGPRGRARRARGCAPVQDADAEPVAVVSGFSADLRWSTVIAGAILVRDGLPWVASNTDLTVPDARTAPAPATAPSSAWSPGSRTASRWSRASRGRRCSRRRCAGSAGSAPWWSGTGWTPTSRARTRPGYDSLLVMTGVTGLGRARRRPARAAAVVRRGRPRRAGTDAPRTHRRGRCRHLGRLDCHGRGRDGCASTATAPTRRLVAGRRHRRLAAPRHDGRPVDVSDLRPPSSVGAEPADD